MTTLSESQLESVWKRDAKGTRFHGPAWTGGPAWPQLMAAIAEAESGGNTDAENPTDNNGTQTSWGLWQISLGNHAEPAPDWNNPDEQVHLAIGKLQSQGLGAWGTFDSGAYKAYLPGGSRYGAPPPSASSPSSAPSSPSSSPGVVWWEPWTYGNAVSGVEAGIVHYAAVGLVVVAGLGLVVAGLFRATGHKAPNPVTFVENAGKTAAPLAAVA